MRKPRPFALRWAEALHPSEWGLAATVVGCGLALGGAHVTVVLVGTLAIAICGALAVRDGSLRKLPPPALLFAALAGYTLLQTVRLPIDTLRALSPAAAEIWSRALLPLGQKFNSGSLSVDPGASSLEAAKWFSYAVAFAVSAAIARRRGAARPIAMVFVSALLIALATLGHGLTGATRVFGIYAPQLGTAANHLGPILNSNCLAGYLVLGVLCGCGFTLSAKTASIRWLSAISTAVLAGMTVLAGSRGGVGALAAGLLVLAVSAYRMRRRRLVVRRLGWHGWMIGLAIVGAGAVFSWLGATDSWFELTHGDLTKLQLGVWTWPMLRDFPAFGVGRGAFESAFPAYKVTADNIIYANPESLPAQWLTEWGIPFGGLALITLAWVFRPGRLGFGRDSLVSAALTGVGAIVLQNLVDFGLELFGPMLAVVVILGACWGQSQTADSAPTSPWLGRRACIALVAATSLSVALAYYVARSPVSLERPKLQADYLKLDPKNVPATRVLWSNIESAMRRHPAEPYFPRLAAVLALRAGDVEPLPWIERALERGPVDSRTHWILAMALQAHGYLGQALLEARLAVEYGPDLAPVVGAAVAGWSPQVEDIERAAPRNTAGSELLIDAGASLDPKRYSESRLRLFHAAAEASPGLARARRMLAEELLNELSDRPATVAQASLESDILKEADALDRLDPTSASGSQVRARLFALTNGIDEADRVLSAQCPRLEQGQRVECWRALFTASVAHPANRRVIQHAAQQLVASACSLELTCEAALLAAGDAMALLGNWPEAIGYFHRATGIEPRVDSLMKLADAALAAGQPGLASRSLELAASHVRRNATLSAQIQAKRQAIFLRAAP